jgi:hypothetical protein
MQEQQSLRRVDGMLIEKLFQISLEESFHNLQDCLMCCGGPYLLYLEMNCCIPVNPFMWVICTAAVCT